MEIKVDEISKIIRQQIEGYEKQTDQAEVGTVISVGDGIARIWGLEDAMAGELLEFPHDVSGLALNLEEDQVGALEVQRIEQAQQVLPLALAPLGDDYLTVLKEGLDTNNGWIDVYPHKDKDSGAFSASVFGVHPYVKMNYFNEVNDLSTLAHEYGHALHSHLSMKNQPYITASYAPFKGQDYAPDRINAAALDFIRVNKDRPFFLYYPTIIPHVALHVPDEELKPYLEMGWDDPPFTRQGGYGYTPHFTPRAAYAAMITRMDRDVGRIVDLVKELGITPGRIR